MNGKPMATPRNRSGANSRPASPWRTGAAVPERVETFDCKRTRVERAILNDERFSETPRSILKPTERNRYEVKVSANDDCDLLYGGAERFVLRPFWQSAGSNL